MIDKTIGVIPPRNELSSFPDKKAENSKEQKSEFESLLNQWSRQSKKSDKKERSDQALGGTKKKVQDTDQKLADKSEKTKKEDNEKETEGVHKKRNKKLVNEEMVLSSMASNESANKIPDSEVNPDHLEETNLLSTSVEVKAAAPQDATAIAMPTDASQISDEALAALMEAQPAMEVPSEDMLAAIMNQLENPQTDVEATAIMANQFTQPEQVDTATQLAAQAVVAAPVEATATDAEVVAVPLDSKVLETLNREQMFQKLETMKKMEDLNAKTESRNTMDGVSGAQTNVFEDNLASFQSADQGQDDFDGNDKETVQLGTVPQHQSHVAKEFSHVTATTQINSPEAAKDAEAANLKEILNQAQYLVTKGGGEVSVKMTPEGMGEVQLKIMMENGKMNLEMNTHDKNVQKMIQDSLSDLKSSLAAHQISVEHVTLNNKISTVQDAQHTQSSQNFTDAHAHHQSQQSHQQRDQRQQAGQVFRNETMKAVPLARTEINKASAHRVYQNNKANSLNAVA